MAAYRIERMGLHDVGAVVSMWEAFEAERGFVPTDAQAIAFGEVMLEVAAPGSPDAVFLALIGKKPVGFLWCQFCETAYGRYPRSLVGRAYYVRPRYRHRHGIADALYEAVYDLAVALKAILAAGCRISDEVFWTKRGFVPVSMTLMREADAPSSMEG